MLGMLVTIAIILGAFTIFGGGYILMFGKFEKEVK
jgi:hypothetical protein